MGASDDVSKAAVEEDRHHGSRIMEEPRKGYEMTHADEPGVAPAHAWVDEQ
jgi:hypothetical protein